MTDRIRQLTVILDQDYRDDPEGVKVIMAALRMIKGVSKVYKGEAVGVNDMQPEPSIKERLG